ncbi:MAG: hypothetical protein EAX96_20685 [Candidatus Lokiarchaeota archaeon]|nr:hypothetical protein [Candidatus Lokiarchaeota archaeon]
MSFKEQKKYYLNDHEKQLLSMLGDTFAIHGRSKNFGLVFAILQLKALNEGQGLDQETIQGYIETNFKPVSVSTISRILNQLTNQGYCDSIEERTEDHGRKRLKFFRKESFKKLFENRINYSILEFEGISTKLNLIKNDILKINNNENEELLELIDYLNEFYRISKKIYEQIKKMSQEELRSL